MNCPFCNKKTADEAKLCAHCGKNIHAKTIDMRKKSILCPTCKLPTSILNLAGVELDFCHECTGIWFDRKEMKQFLKVIAEEKSAGKIYRLLNEMAFGDDRRKRGSYIQCPICKDLMIQRNYLEISGILLDQCLDHGTWADKQDLISILDLISTGDMEELVTKASNKLYKDLEKRIRMVELEQKFIKADISRTKRNHKAHLALDVLGIL